MRQCDQCSNGETQEGHGRRAGRVVREGFLKKGTVGQSFEDESESHQERRKESGIKFQMA